MLMPESGPESGPGSATAASPPSASMLVEATMPPQRAPGREECPRIRDASLGPGRRAQAKRQRAPSRGKTWKARRRSSRLNTYRSTHTQQAVATGARRSRNDPATGPLLSAQVVAEERQSEAASQGKPARALSFPPKVEPQDFVRVETF